MNDPDRRPLKSREKKWALNFASILIQKEINPDHISILSFVFAAIGGIKLFAAGMLTDADWSYWLFLGAALDIQLRLLCNLFDGMVAVGLGISEPSGKFFNEFPDRLSDVVILVGAGYSIQCFSFGATLGWAAAVVALLTAYVRNLGQALGTQSYFSGPMAKQQRMAVMTIACLLEFLAGGFISSQGGRPGYWISLGLVVIILGGLFTFLRRTIFVLEELKSDDR